MTPDQLDQHRAADDGMPEPRYNLDLLHLQPGEHVIYAEQHADHLIVETEGPVSRGMKVRSTTGNRGGIGIVTGHDADLDLPLVDWPDGTGPEAMEPHEYEVVA